MYNKEDFKFNKLDAIKQFHIIRRLAPVVGELMAVVTNASNLMKNGKKAEDATLDDIDFDVVAKNIGPLMEALAKLPDADVDYCLYGLLSAAERKITGGGWAKVTTPDGKHLMFEDIKLDMVFMMSICAGSFMANIAGFINALPSGLKEGALNSRASG